MTLRNKKMTNLVRKPKKLLRKHSGKDVILPSFEDDRNLEIFKELEAKARQAINCQKIFLIVGGFETIRLKLLQRGWIEKTMDSQIIHLTEKMISETVGSYETHRMVLSYLVKNSPTHFIWIPKHFNEIPMNISTPFRNRINRMRTSDFTLKEGLHNLAENIQWFSYEDLADYFNYPRSFLLMNMFQRDFFLNEFRKTLIISFIFFINDFENFDCLFSEDGDVAIDVIYNSIERIDHLIKVKQHLCIDLGKTIESQNTTLTQQIDLVVNQRKKIRYPDYVNGFSMDKLRAKIKVAVAEIHVHWPYSKYDSSNNIW